MWCGAVSASAVWDVDWSGWAVDESMVMYGAWADMSAVDSVDWLV